MSYPLLQYFWKHGLGLSGHTGTRYANELLYAESIKKALRLLSPSSMEYAEEMVDLMYPSVTV